MAKDWKNIENPDEIDETEEQHPETPRGALEHPDYQELETKLTEAEQRADKYWNDFLRTQADIENIKRRFEKDLENTHKFGVEKFVSALLPALDSIETSVDMVKSNTTPGLEKIQQGLELTLKLTLDVFKKFGIEQVSPKGQPFDPAFHEAMSQVPSKDVPSHHVVDVLQKGYLLNGRLIRPALVIVAK